MSGGLGYFVGCAEPLCLAGGTSPSRQEVGFPVLFGVCAKLPSPPRLEAAPRAHAHTSPQLSPVRDSVTSAQPSSSGVCLDVSA